MSPLYEGGMSGRWRWWWWLSGGIRGVMVQTLSQLSLVTVKLLLFSVKLSEGKFNITKRNHFYKIILPFCELELTSSTILFRICILLSQSSRLSLAVSAQLSISLNLRRSWVRWRVSFILWRFSLSSWRDSAMFFLRLYLFLTLMKIRITPK